ncbi:MAG: hypothetical protein QW093_06280 [Candidatus Bathyarchaeia archaeon]
MRGSGRAEGIGYRVRDIGGENLWWRGISLFIACCRRRMVDRISLAISF